MKILILAGFMLIMAILILSCLAYANQIPICNHNPADCIIESWLQGIARILK